MISLSKIIKAFSLECLGPQTVQDTPRNSEIFGELEKLDVEFMSCSCKADRISILARVYELCLIMDVN